MRSDKEIVKMAVRNDPTSFKFADSSLQSDKELVLVVVGLKGECLSYASEELKKD